MCGLVGVFTKFGSGFSMEQREAFRTLLVIDSLRGEDSTGVFMVHQDGDVDIAKKAVTAGQFIREKEWDKLYSNSLTRAACLIGHNRKATKGLVNDENAHPFIVEDKIILAHNGGIFGDHKQHADVEVDSHAIAHLLVKHPVEEALGKFRGAYSLIWYDVEKEAVNIIRNDQRPMWWMETDNAWLWASERNMLLFTAHRCGLKIKENPKEIDPETLNIFQLKGRYWDVSNRKIEIKEDFPVAPVGGAANDAGESEFMNLPWDWKKQQEKWKQDMNSPGPGVDDENLSGPKQVSGRNAKFILKQPCTVTCGAHTWEMTCEFEKDMAIGCSRTLTLRSFNTDIANYYKVGEKVRACVFEYMDDGEGGFYIYASPRDDPDMIIRHHFKRESRPDEMRIMNMSCNEWLLEFTIEKISWTELEKAERCTENQEGYCLITSSVAVIIDGGPYKAGKRKDNAHA